jgi:hypothetical protein
MALQSLLLTTDQQVLHRLRSVLRDLGIGVEICHRAAQATECLRRRHFDVAVLDCDAPGVEEVIGQLRTAPGSRNAPLFLIGPTDSPAQAPFAGQADHVLPRPLPLEQTWRALRHARQRMEFTMFRYCRVRIDAAALLRCSGGRTVEAGSAAQTPRLPGCDRSPGGDDLGRRKGQSRTALHPGGGRVPSRAGRLDRKKIGRARVRICV